MSSAFAAKGSRVPSILDATDAERVAYLNAGPMRNGDYVLYWMQAAQRVRANPALNHAVNLANELAKPLVVCFCLRGDVPGAAPRHYAFMLEGLAETARAVAKLGAAFVMLTEREPDALAAGAAAAVTDCGYLPWQLEWRRRMAGAFPCRFVQVESDVAIPVDGLALGEEYAAASLRPKLHRLIAARLRTPLTADSPPPLRIKAGPGCPALPSGLSAEAPCPDRMSKLPSVSGAVGPVAGFKGGERAAWRRLSDFIAHKLAAYASDGNDPARDVCSGLSPYLHFGQISSLAVAREVLSRCSDEDWPPRRRPSRGGAKTEASESPHAGRDAFLEQLLVRRELAINFVIRNPAHAAFAGLPAWARRTLERHRADPRPYTYSEKELENAATHDPYWNAAQRQMVETGHMHNYMRMYWGKKVVEWTRRPEDAFALLLRLNDTYQLDGRDPNGIAGVAWCFGKHDRPWRERAVFGQVRYMNAAGLERKFDLADYLERYSDARGGEK